MTSTKHVAIIVDISHSKDHDDRQLLQHEVLEAFARVNETIPSLQPLEATIGDEFQAVYSSLSEALSATLLARLHLPEGVDCRFGLGQGEVRTVAEGRAGLIQDGPGWWAAREAVEQARTREYSRFKFVRTWFVSETDTSPNTDSRAPSALINAYLVCRDQIVSDMKPRARRALRGQLMHETQAEIAFAENVTQSAVSQTLHNSGAIALLASEHMLAQALA